MIAGDTCPKKSKNTLTLPCDMFTRVFLDLADLWTRLDLVHLKSEDARAFKGGFER